MNTFVGIPAELLFSIIGAFGVYIFFDFKKQVKEKIEGLKGEINLLNSKLEKIEKGEFVEKTVHNVFNSPDFRRDLKEIIKESVMSVEKHESANLKSSLMSILDEMQLINKKIK